MRGKFGLGEGHSDLQKSRYRGPKPHFVLVFTIQVPLGTFLGVLLGSFDVLESKTGSLKATKSLQAKACHRNPAHFGEFWEPLGAVFGFMLEFFLDILSAIFFQKLGR